MLTRSRGDFDDLLERSDLVVELMGGTDPAREYVLRALGAGRHVVTANKQLLSQFGEELFDAARENQVQLRFEAAVAGVVPAIRVMSETLAAAHIERVHGIVNGTTNYILTEMARTGASYEEALREAQELGYAEADPTEDVTGKDAAAKMAILARLAFNTAVHLDQVSYEGIEQITADDIAYAKQLGLSLKLIGSRGAHRQRHRGARAPRLPVRGPPAGVGQRRLQRGDDRVARHHRDHALGSRGRRSADGLGRAGRRDLGDHPAAVAAAAGGHAADRDRRGVLLLPAPRGGGPPGRAGPGGRDPRACRACRSGRWCSTAWAATPGS